MLGWHTRENSQSSWSSYWYNRLQSLVYDGKESNTYKISSGNETTQQELNKSVLKAWNGLGRSAWIRLLEEICSSVVIYAVMSVTKWFVNMFLLHWGGGGGGWGDMLHRNSFVASFMKLIFITIYAFFLQWYIRLGRSAWNQHWWTGTPSWKTA